MTFAIFCLAAALVCILVSAGAALRWEEYQWAEKVGYIGAGFLVYPFIYAVFFK